MDPLRRLAPLYPARLPLSGVDCSTRASKITALGCGFLPFSDAQQQARTLRQRRKAPRRQPASDLLIDHRPGREIAGQVAPGRAGMRQRAHGVEDGAQLVFALQGGRCEQSQIGHGDGLFLVAHVAGGGGRVAILHVTISSTSSL